MVKKYKRIHKCSVFLKSANFVSFTDKNFKCLTEIKILSVRMSDTKIQDILHRTTNLSDRKFLGLARCIFLSDRMSDKFKKFSRSLNVLKKWLEFYEMLLDWHHSCITWVIIIHSAVLDINDGCRQWLFCSVSRGNYEKKVLLTKELLTWFWGNIWYNINTIFVFLQNWRRS